MPSSSLTLGHGAAPFLQFLDQFVDAGDRGNDTDLGNGAAHLLDVPAQIRRSFAPNRLVPINTLPSP